MNDVPLVLLDLLLKSTLVALLALGLAFLLRRGPAGLRRGLWLAAFFVLAIVLGISALHHQPGWSWLPAQARTIKIPPASAPIRIATEARMPSEPATMAGPLLASPTRTPWRWQSWLFGFWALGVFAVVARRAAGALQLMRLHRTSSPVRSAGLIEAFDEARRTAAVRDRVCLRQSPRCPVPMMWGWRRPVILLPEALAAREASRLANVLRHELMHVRHRDVPARWLSTAACALHWWNPLVWIGARSFHQAQEEACDEAVLRLGSDPVGYAEDLMSSVNSLRRGFPAGGIAMARASTLRRRVERILNASAVRTPLSRWNRVLLASFVLALAVPCLLVGVKAAAETPRAKPAATTGGPITTTTRDKLIRVRLKVFECPPEMAARFRREAGFLKDRTNALVDRDMLNKALRVMLSDEKAKTVAYPPVITLSGREVLIRSVVNVPEAVSGSAVAHKQIGTQCSVLPRLEHGGATLSVSIKYASTSEDWSTGSVSLGISGLSSLDQSIVSLLEDGNGPFVTREGRQQFVVTSFEVLEAGSHPADSLSGVELTRMERAAVEARLRGRYDFVRADAADVARYIAGDARNQHPKTGFKLFVVEEGVYPQVTFLLENPTLHEVLELIAEAGARVEYHEDFIKLLPLGGTAKDGAVNRAFAGGCVVSLEHAKAEDVVKMLSGSVRLLPGETAEIVEGSNSVRIIASPARLGDLLAFVRLLDVTARR
jgi:beta-lactamase regulating signal transducer with metallopeptidase domain